MLKCCLLRSGCTTSVTDAFGQSVCTSVLEPLHEPRLNHHLKTHDILKAITIASRLGAMASRLEAIAIGGDVPK